MQGPNERYRQKEDGEVGEDVERSLKVVHDEPVDACTRNAGIPSTLEWVAAEDQREHTRDGVAGDDAQQHHDCDVEPSHGERLEVEEKHRDLDAAHR